MSQAQPIDICQADVEDKMKLALFLKKREDWMSWLNKDKVHSLQSQVSELFWQDAIYRTFWKIVDLNLENNDSEVGYPSAFMELFRWNFFYTQCMRIRRLCDRLDERESRSVVSITAFIEDIKKNKVLITRENFVCCTGYKYDVSEMRREHMKKLTEGACFTPTEICHPEALHDRFDKLSGVASRNRKRSDLIDSELLNELNKIRKMPKCRQVAKLANKFYAHSATGKSRNDHELEVSLNDFDECYKEIVRAAGLIADIVGIGVGLDLSVPTPIYDIFEHVDKPMIRKSDVPKLQQFWDERCEEISSLRNNR